MDLLGDADLFRFDGSKVKAKDVLANKKIFLVTAKVIKWLHYLFNIWLFTTIKIGPKA